MNRKFQEGWLLVGLTSAVVVACLGYFFVRHGWSGEGLRGVIRATARTSFVLFLAAFSASSLATLLPFGATRWQLAHRRHLGISFALSHLVHGAAIVTLAWRTGGGSLTAQVIGLSSAGVLYAFIVFMLVTSLDGPAAWVGPRWWKAVHASGSYLIFLTLLATYGRKAVESPIYLVQVILLLIVLGLRLASRGRRRRSVTTQEVE